MKITDESAKPAGEPAGKTISKNAVLSPQQARQVTIEKSTRKERFPVSLNLITR